MIDMRHCVLIAAVFYLGACTTDMVERTKVDTTTITWVDQVPSVCGGSLSVHGCATWTDDRSRCAVVMPKDSPDWLVAHEMKHCFGFVHR